MKIDKTGATKIILMKGVMKQRRKYVRLCVFSVVIQQQTASQGKPTRHPTFYMLIKTHNKTQDKPLLKETIMGSQ